MSVLGRLFGKSRNPEPPSAADPPPAAAPAAPAAPAAASPAPAEAREQADRLIGLGQQHEDTGDLAAAEQCFRDAIELAPRHARGHLNIGNVLRSFGRLRAAADAYHDALDCDPDHGGAHFNLGTVLVGLGQHDDAKTHLERALELDPRMADAAIMLASACEASGDFAGARRQLERALAIDPGHAGAKANLEALPMQQRDPVAAEQALRDALRADPDSVAALVGIAGLESQRGKAALADGPYRRALQLDPRNAHVWSSFLFSLNFRDDLDAAAIAREHVAFGKIFEGDAIPVARTRTPGSRIRIGYVSPDLRKHAVAVFLLPVLEAHDRKRFEVFCYSNGMVEDEITQRFAQLSDGWRSITGRDDAWADALIRSDEIDILVDLCGHTDRNRLGVFARKPAPVQATWLGYLNTTGLRAMDYRICDRHTNPEDESEALGTETLARMPDSQWCYAPYQDIPLPRRHADAGRPLVFASFNQFVKVNDACLDLWSAVLRELPESHLRVYRVPACVDREEFLGRLEHRGVNRARVALHGNLPALDYFAAIADADIALDSIPCNGATTSLDALWMGTPIVGIRGDRGYSRGTYSILSGSQIIELIAANPQEYVAMNVRLANDPVALETLSRSLRGRLEASPLMDPRRFTRELESLYESMLAGR